MSFDTLIRLFAEAKSDKKEKDIKIKVIESGYNYVDIDYIDCFSWGGLCICMRCNGLFKNGKLIWALHDTMCPSCFQRWVKETNKSAKKYPKEEMDMEMAHQANESELYYKRMLNIEKLSKFEADSLWNRMSREEKKNQ